MKKTVKKILYIFILTMFLWKGSALALTLEPVEAPYTEEYIEYMELTEEEKSKTLEPRKYDFSSQKNSTNETLLQNEKITLKNLINVLRSSATATEKSFSLKDIIANNVIVRNQKNVNACWAFASISSLETNLALKNYQNQIAEKLYDFSERHMAYTMTQSLTGDETNPYGYSYHISEGGHYLMATAYLTNGQGAVSETDMPFVDTQEDIEFSEIQNKTVQTTVNDIVWLDSIADVKNADETELANLQQQVKEHVSTYGAVYAGVYAPDGSEQSENYINWDTGAMYVDEITSWTETDENQIEIAYSSKPNHAVSIIGWNDEYAKENFTTQPNNDGAWIVKNSWGEKDEITFAEIKEMIGGEATDEQLTAALEILEQAGYTVDEENQTASMKIGDNGIFYVSYEDVTIYTDLFGIVSASDSKTYDNLYQHDLLGLNYSASYEQTKTQDTYIANVYERDIADTDYLTSIGITSFVGGTYEVYINPNGSSKAEEDLQKAELTTGSEITLTPGYHTITLQKPYQLTGNHFVIALKLKHTEGEYTYLPFESPDGDENSSANAGESFITFESFFGTDSNWVDISDPEDTQIFVGNFCIKGITVDTYSGDIANSGTENPGEENPGNNTTNENTAGGNQTGNETGSGNTIGNNTTGGDITQEDNPVNSNFNEAKAYLTNVKINQNSDNISFEMKIEIRNIQVSQINDSYEHGYYITSNSNQENIPNSKWLRVDSFERQEDGTYTLALTVDDESQLADVEEDSQNAYIYIKEIATMGTETATAISNAMLIDIDTADLEFDRKDEGEQVVVYQPQQENQNTSTTISDNTTSVTNLPKTGIKTVFIVIGVIAIVFVITYIKYRKLKDVK